MLERKELDTTGDQPRKRSFATASAETKLLTLQNPVGRKIGHLGDTQTARQSAVDSSLHNVRRQESKRQRRADSLLGDLMLRCQRCNVLCIARYELVHPTSSLRDSLEKSRPRFAPDGSRRGSRFVVTQDFPLADC